MKRLVLPFALIAFVSCNDVTEKTCTCIRTAANNGIIEGTKLDEEDLVNLCIESKEKLRALPLDEKNVIVKCVDSALDRIANKDPFPTNDSIKLLPINSTKEITDYVTKLKNRETYDGAIKAKTLYHFFKRTMSGTLMVVRVNTTIYDQPIIDDGRIEVYGYTMDETQNPDKKLQIRLRLPANEVNNIRKSRWGYGSEETIYNQSITFNGLCTDFGITLGNVPSIFFTVDDYKLNDLTDPTPPPMPVTDSIDTAIEAYSDSAYNNIY